MERSVMDITLELTQSYSHTQVTVKRGDTHRSLRIHLADGGRPYHIGENCTAIFTAVKPDGSHLFNTCRVEDAVIYDLTPQTTALPGQLECELRIYGDDGALLTSAAFGITVADTVYTDGDENIASTGEATALTKLVSDATEKLTQMEAVLKNEVDHATIDDAKVGADAWSSKNIVDKLCPAFTESGSVVTCTPLEGYPLEVVSTINAKADGKEHESIALTRCGKNLFHIDDFESENANTTWFSSNGTFGRECHTLSITSSNLLSTAVVIPCKLPPGTYVFSVEWVRVPSSWSSKPAAYAVVTLEDGTAVNMKEGTPVTLNQAGTVTEIKSSSFALKKGDVHVIRVQIEAGDTPTAYEPYQGKTYTAEPSEAAEEYTWQNIPALPGINTLYSDCGHITVTGRKDLITLLQKFTK